jgi:transmembrane sensor
MSQPHFDPIKSVSVRARAEAAGWMAKLHGPSRTPIVESAWRHWLAEHPEHAAAWELATDAWADTDNLPFVLPRRAVPRSPVWFRHPLLRPIAATAAICSILAGVTIHYMAKPAVTTTFGEQRTLNLPDGTRVELNTNSRLVLQFDNRTRTVELKTGEAYFNVAHERRPFVVIAGPRKIIAVGTSFLVRRNEAADNSVTVTLIEGRVAVAPISAPDILPSKPTLDIALLSAGKRLRAAQHTAPTIDTPSVDQETAWMRGQLIFHDTPLRDAVAEFNRYSTMQIKFTSAAIGEIPVGGVFRIGDSASFAAAVAQSRDLRLITRDHELVLVSMEDNQPR